MILSCGCSSNGTPGNEGRYDEFRQGTVIPKVTSLGDQSVSYALYLPSTYAKGKVFPVMIAFDPHAGGNLPVEKYHTLAEKYGLILIGSNDSENGLQPGQSEAIIRALLNDSRNRFATDTNRVYLLGFSGGARIATMVALYGGGIRGVIGCGAGFPGGNEPGRFRFDYIGIAGNEDFNMNELVSLDDQLDKANFRHALLIFNGKHEWPPLEIMEQAFTWNLFCAMKEGLVPKDEKTISLFTENLSAGIEEDEKTGDPWKQYQDLKQGIRFLDGLGNTGNLSRQLTAIQASPEFRTEEASVVSIREKEMNLQRMYAENFFLKEMTWWKKTIKDYGLRITNGKDQPEVLMYKRIMSYLSLLAYMQYTGAVSQGNREKAGFALEVYRIVDPENAAKIK